MSVEIKLALIADEMVDSTFEGERAYGMYLSQHIRFLPESEVIPALRKITEEMKQAVYYFERRWEQLIDSEE